MNSELVGTLVNKFEESASGINQIVIGLEHLVEMLEKLDRLSTEVHDSRTKDFARIAQTVEGLYSRCEQIMEKVVGKSRELDVYVANLDQYADKHEKELKKSVKSFAGLAKSIAEFNQEVRPDVENLERQVGELEHFREDLRNLSGFVESLKEKIDGDTNDLRTKISKLNSDVEVYYKQNMAGLKRYVEKIDKYSMANHQEMERLNGNIEGLLATNIAFNQIYEKVLSDGETYKKVIAGMMKEWAEENLSKSAFKGGAGKSLMGNFFGKEK